MGSFDKLERVPPMMPILWQDWINDPDTRRMTETQVGIFFKLLLTQWQQGSLPRRASYIAEDAKTNYKTTLRFLQTYSHLIVCCQCSASWSDSDCKCGATKLTGRCHNLKLSFLRNDVNLGLALGTTEPKPEPKPKPEQEPSRFAAVIPYTPEAETHGSKEQDFEPEPVMDDEPDATPITRKFIDEILPKLGRSEFKNGVSRDACNRAFEKLLLIHSAGHINSIMDYMMDNEVFKRACKTVQRVDPWDWFYEKFDSMETQMEADEEFGRDRRNRISKESGKPKPTYQTEGDSFLD